MSRTRSFPPELLARLRDMPVSAVLDALGLYWKRDPDFRPLKDKATIRVHVSLEGGRMVEFLAKGPKWYDTRAKKGGGGAIDLTMYLFEIDFVSAVKRLQLSGEEAVE